MNGQKCLAILRDIKSVAFATVDEAGLPAVRMIDIMLAEQDRLYFCTARGKDFYRQLLRGGYVAITGLNREYQMVRLVGKARPLLERRRWIDRIFDENPSMHGVYPGDSRYILEPFCIDNGQLEFFDLGKSPVVRKYFTLGGQAEKPTGFEIKNSCVGCGTCRKSCPQQCIDSGVPFRIRQENCLHCGLCFENCPAGAIVKRGEAA